MKKNRLSLKKLKTAAFKKKKEEDETEKENNEEEIEISYNF